MFIRRVSTILFIFAMQISQVQASEGLVVPIDAAQWRTLSVPGARENTFRVKGDTLEVMSDASVSFRYFEIPPNKPAPSVLSWRWKVDSHSSLAPQTVKGKDDRPLAIHVWFDKAGADTVLSGLTARVGKPKVGKLLSYVWGAQEPAGSVLENPYYRKGRVIVLVGEDGQIGEWATVQRDIVADYRRAFGAEPDMSRLRYIAISADTDDLNGQSSASVRELAFGLR